MDKFEYKMRSEEIKSLIENKEYAEAMVIADSIDWTRVKSVMMLTMVSDLYKMNKRYDISRDILELAYERCPGGRTIVYSLCELCIKLEDFVQAVEYYKEFVQLAPRDSGKFILQYKLYEAQNVGIEERIEVLEEFKQHERRERWCYELAFLYHRIGLATKCVEECDEIALWFGSGKYVMKALELKMLHEPLTPEQEEKYKNRNKPQAPEKQAAVQGTRTENTSAPAQNVVSGDTKEFNVRDIDFKVKTFDVENQFNTINIQKEIAASMKDLLQPEETAQNVQTAQKASIARDDTDDLDTYDLDEDDDDEVDVEDADVKDEDIEDEAAEDNDADEKGAQKSSEVTFDTIERSVISTFMDEEEKQEVPVIKSSGDMQEIFFGDEEQTGVESEEQKKVPVGTVSDPFYEMEEVPKEYADKLSQEYDGQISLVVPQSDMIEKQITGQLNIEDILAEWERMKQNLESKRAQEVKARVIRQTGEVLSQFEAAKTGDTLAEMEAVADAQIVKDGGQEYKEEPAVEEESPLFESQEMLEDIDPETVAQLSILNGLKEADEAVEAEEGFEELEEIEEPVTEMGEDAASDVIDENEEIEAAAEEEFDLDTDLTEAETDQEEAIEQETEDEIETETETETKIETETVDESEETEAEAEEQATEEAEEAGAEQEAEALEEADKSQKKAAKVRDLTVEEKELFGSMAEPKAMKRQIASALDNITLAAYTGNIIITGEPGSGTMTLAKNLIKSVQQADSNFSGKVARISGGALNNKNIPMTFDKLKNGAIIIEKAGGLNEESLKLMNRYLDNENNGIIIVMEDTKKEMRKLLAKNSQIQENFTARVDIEEVDTKSLVKYGREYAYSLEYSIDEMGVLALYTRISDMQTGDHNVTLEEVRNIVDEAIWSARRKTPKHFFDVVFAKRYDSEDMIILREKDFIC